MPAQWVGHQDGWSQAEDVDAKAHPALVKLPSLECLVRATAEPYPLAEPVASESQLWQQGPGPPHPRTAEPSGWELPRWERGEGHHPEDSVSNLRHLLPKQRNCPSPCLVGCPSRYQR